MAHQFLSNPDVDTTFKPVGCEGMPNGVSANEFANTGFAGRCVYRFLKTGWVHMMPTGFSRPAVNAQFLSGEKVLPTALHRCVSIFTG